MPPMERERGLPKFSVATTRTSFPVQAESISPRSEFQPVGEGRGGGLIAFFASPTTVDALFSPVRFSPFPPFSPNFRCTRSQFFSSPLAGVTRRNCERVSFSSVDRRAVEARKRAAASGARPGVGDGGRETGKKRNKKTKGSFPFHSPERKREEDRAGSPSSYSFCAR